MEGKSPIRIRPTSNETVIEDSKGLTIREEGSKEDILHHAEEIESHWPGHFEIEISETESGQAQLTLRHQ